MASRGGSIKKASKKKGATRKRRSGKVEPPHPVLQRIALFLLRAFPGAILLDAVHYKVTARGVGLGQALEDFWRLEYRPRIEQTIASPPHVFGVRFDAFGQFLDSVMLGSETWERVLSGGILTLEAVFGLCLVLGLCTRLVAVLAALLMAVFGLAKANWFLGVRSANWPMVVLLVAAALLAAGRAWGLDAKLQHRLPRWIA